MAASQALPTVTSPRGTTERNGASIPSPDLSRPLPPDWASLRSLSVRQGTRRASGLTRCVAELGRHLGRAARRHLNVVVGLHVCPTPQPVRRRRCPIVGMRVSVFLYSRVTIPAPKTAAERPAHSPHPPPPPGPSPGVRQAHKAPSPPSRSSWFCATRCSAPTIPCSFSGLVVPADRRRSSKPCSASTVP